jgi:hypothetical protein
MSREIRSKIDLSEVLNEFDYDSTTGELIVRKRNKRSRRPIEKQGWIDNKGYRRIYINGKKYLYHRIVFLINHGYQPKYIDHIDGDILNNRISNLRECDSVQNCSNRKKPICNSTGHKNIYKMSDGKFRVFFTHNNIRYEVGIFSELISAKKNLLIKSKEIRGDFFSDR